MAKLYVIAGHGAGDPGACANGYQEAERVRALAARMKALGGADVEVLDTSRNWYADNGISSLSIPSSACLIELHMDSAAASARGGHVVIQGGYSADEYDTALAKFISGYFPGRSSTISKRTDLANPNRAAARGINYRLLECCFISNAQDIAKFNANMDAVAAGILGAFGIKAASSTSSSASKPAASTGKLYRVQVGAFANKANAERLMKELQGKGYSCIIKAE
jgi:N-acetylmuramoyl-L-alanine amidase